MSCTAMRSLLPAARTLPSSTWRTSSCSPIARTSSAESLKAKADVRATTRSPRTRVSALISSSVRPSLNQSSAVSGLRLTKGSAAIERVAASCGRRGRGDSSGAASPVVAPVSDGVRRTPAGVMS